MADVGTPAMRVALIDDDAAIAQSLARVLEPHGAALTHLHDGAQIEALLATAGDVDPWDVILLDVNLPGFDGLEVLHRLRSRGTPSAVVMITGDSRAATATAALRAGAYHYVVKPFVNADLVKIIEMAARQTALARQLRPVPATADLDLERVLVGESAALRELRLRIRQLARSPVSVLVSGESGTGKEVVARALHALSDRRDHRFVPLHCGGVPEALIEAELFGTEGAAGGARAGAFVEADRGTLFLDEIGDMPLAVQARLLRAIQHGEVHPVGGLQPRAAAVRVIAATSTDLARAVAAGHFRPDLFFRLNVVHLTLPPLRDRRGDLPLLVSALLTKHRRPPPPVSDRTLELLHAYTWPGNVRELENALLHGLAVSGGDCLEPSSLPPHVTGTSPFATGSSTHTRPDENLTLSEAKRRAALDFERIFLVRLMERSHGSVAAAARLAGIDRTNFRRLLQRHGIDSAQFR